VFRFTSGSEVFFDVAYFCWVLVREARMNSWAFDSAFSVATSLYLIELVLVCLSSVFLSFLAFKMGPVHLRLFTFGYLSGRPVRVLRLSISDKVIYRSSALHSEAV